MKGKNKENKHFFSNKNNPCLNSYINGNSRRRNSSDKKSRQIKGFHRSPNNKNLKHYITNKNFSRFKSDLTKQKNNNNNRRTYKSVNLTSKIYNLQIQRFIKQIKTKSVKNNILLKGNNFKKKYLLNNKFYMKNNIVLKNAVLIIENWWLNILHKRNIIGRKNSDKNKRNNKNNSKELYICISNNNTNIDSNLIAQTDDGRNANILWNISRDLHETNVTSNKNTKSNSLFGTNFTSSKYNYNNYSKFKILNNNYINSQQTTNNNRINLNKNYLNVSNIEKYFNKCCLNTEKLILKKQNRTKSNKVLKSNKFISYPINKKINKYNLLKNPSPKKNKDSPFRGRRKYLGLQCKIFDDDYEINFRPTQEKIKRVKFYNSLRTSKSNNENKYKKLKKLTNSNKNKQIKNNSKKNIQKSQKNSALIKYEIFKRKIQNRTKKNIFTYKNISFENLSNISKANKNNTDVVYDSSYLFSRKNDILFTYNYNLKRQNSANQILLNNNSKKKLNSNKKNKILNNHKKTDTNSKEQKNILKKNIILKKSLCFEKKNNSKFKPVHLYIQTQYSYQNNTSSLDTYHIIPHNIKNIHSKINETIKTEHSDSKTIIINNNNNPSMSTIKTNEEKKNNETLINPNISFNKTNKEAFILSVTNLKQNKNNKIKRCSKRTLLNDKIVSITPYKKQNSIEVETPRLSTAKDNHNISCLRQEFILEQLENDSDILRIQDHNLLRENPSNRSTFFLKESERNSADVILRNVNVKKYSNEVKKEVKICKKTKKSKNKIIEKRKHVNVNSGHLSDYCCTINNEDDFSS